MAAVVWVLAHVPVTKEDDSRELTVTTLPGGAVPGLPSIVVIPWALGTLAVITPGRRLEDEPPPPPQPPSASKIVGSSKKEAF